MWFSSKMRIETIFEAFDKRNQLIVDSLANSIAIVSVDPLFLKRTPQSNTLFKDNNFLRILNIECSIYTFLFFDLLLFQKEVSTEKRRYITNYFFEKICAQNELTSRQLDEITKPRQELYTKRVKSSANHLGENLKDMVERVVYGFLEGEMCSGALALNGDPLFTFQIYSAFQDEYIEGMKSSSLKKLLEDIKSKPIENTH